MLAEADWGWAAWRGTGRAAAGTAQTIEKLPHLTFEGITFYPATSGLDETGQRALAHSPICSLHTDEFRRAGLEPRS